MSDATAVRTAIDRLGHLLHRVPGAGTIEAPGRQQQRDVDELVRQLAPLQVPEDVLEWWRCVGIRALPIEAYPCASDPAFSLTMWRMARDEGFGVPRCLVQVAYQSHVVLSVEAAPAGSPAPGVYYWAVDDCQSFEHVAPDWATILHAWGDVLEAGGYAVYGGTPHLDGELTMAAMRARASTTPVPDGFPGREAIFANPSEWPLRWRTASGIDLAARAPRGRTVTVAEVLGAPSDTTHTGTIVGRVITLARTGPEILAVLDDGTGVLDVGCPVTLCTWVPVVGQDFEFDIVADTTHTDFGFLAEQHRRVSDAVLAGDLPGSQAEAAALATSLAAHRPTATATAIRPAT